MTDTVVLAVAVAVVCALAPGCTYVIVLAASKAYFQAKLEFTRALCSSFNKEE